MIDSKNNNNYSVLKLSSAMIGFSVFYQAVAISILGIFLSWVQLSLALTIAISVLNKPLQLIPRLSILTVFVIISILLLGVQMKDQAEWFVVFLRSVSYFLYLSCFFILFYYRNNVNFTNTAVKGMFLGFLTSIFLGFLQYFYFKFFQVNLFPYDLFYGEGVRSALANINGVSKLRVTALGGEPKVYGMSLALFTVFLVFMKKVFDVKRRILFIGASIFLCVQTASTSALVVLAVGLLAFYISIWLNKNFLVSFYPFYIFLLFLISLIILIFPVAQVESQLDSFSYLNARLFARINGLEDYDYATVMTLRQSLPHLFIGGGWPYLNLLNNDINILSTWMTFETIFVPKMGVLTVISIFGLLGFSFLLICLIFVARKYNNNFDKNSFVFIFYLIPMVFYLRSYLFVMCILLFLFVWNRNFVNRDL
jgi:hypothetical protein